MAGRDQIREWITGVMASFPAMEFPTVWSGIEGNRVVSVAQNWLPDPTGGDAEYQFPGCVVLHYAGNDQWSYEEDIYSPDEAFDVVGRWVEAGGQLPEGFDLEGLQG